MLTEIWSKFGNVGFTEMIAAAHIVPSDFLDLKWKRGHTNSDHLLFYDFLILQLNYMLQNSEFSLANLTIQITSRYVNGIFCELK